MNHALVTYIVQVDGLEVSEVSVLQSGSLDAT